MKTTFELRVKFPVSPNTIFYAWLDSQGHSEMTGAEANCSNSEGGEFTAWDGYISGKNKQLVQDKLIKQSWRTTDFNSQDEDSELVIEFQETESGCELILTHNDIPQDQPDYKQGWIDHYFNPMKTYFEEKNLQ